MHAASSCFVVIHCQLEMQRSHGEAITTHDNQREQGEYQDLLNRAEQTLIESWGHSVQLG